MMELEGSRETVLVVTSSQLNLYSMVMKVSRLRPNTPAAEGQS